MNAKPLTGQARRLIHRLHALGYTPEQVRQGMLRLEQKATTAPTETAEPIQAGKVGE